VEKEQDWLKLRNFESFGMLITEWMSVGSFTRNRVLKNLLTFPRPQQQQQNLKSKLSLFGDV